MKFVPLNHTSERFQIINHLDVLCVVLKNLTFTRHIRMSKSTR